MKYYSCLLLLLTCICINKANAQYYGPPDTSFTFNSAYKGVLKANPQATIPVINVGDSVKSVRDIVYCTVNNHQLKLDVFYPNTPSATPMPAVLLVFGGGWRSGDRSMHVPMAQELAARGYVTITADYRLSTEAIYPAAVNDLKTAIKWMRANAKAYHINKNKIAIWEFSAGGQLATLVGTTGNSKLFKGNDIYQKQPDAVQAIVDVDGTLAFIHPESSEGNDDKRISSATYWFGAPKTQHVELWHQAAALNHIDKNTPPILFLNSGVDRMHAGRNDAIRKLDSLHIYSEVHTFAGAPHSFNMFNPWFWPTVNYTVAFLDKVLKGK
jgi:pectinesterase